MEVMSNLFLIKLTTYNVLLLINILFTTNQGYKKKSLGLYSLIRNTINYGIKLQSSI